MSSCKYLKIEDPCVGDEADQRMRENDPENIKSKPSKRTKRVLRQVSKAGPATVRRWQVSLTAWEVQLTKVHSKYKYASGKIAKKKYQREQREPCRFIRKYTELLQKCLEFQVAETAATGKLDDGLGPSDADDKSNSCDESGSDSSQGSSANKSDNDFELRAHQPPENTTLPQPLVQNARQVQNLPLASPKPPAQTKNTITSTEPVPSRAPSNPTVLHSMDFVHILELSVGAIIGVNGSRLRQIERETNTWIRFAPKGHGSLRECRIQGSQEAIAKVKAIFDKLLNFEKTHEEGRRLDAAVKDHLLLYPMGSPTRRPRPQPQPQSQSSSSAVEAVSKRISSTISASAQSKLQSLPTQSTSQSAKPDPNDSLRVPHTSALNSASSRKRLDGISDSDSDPDPDSDISSSSDSSSDEEQAIASPVTPPALAQSQLPSTNSRCPNNGSETHRQSKKSRFIEVSSAPAGAAALLPQRPRTPQMGSAASVSAGTPLPPPPPPRALTPFQVPAGSTIVKIEDDSEAGSPLQAARPDRAHTPEAAYQAYDLGLVPVNGRISLDEFKDILITRDKREAKLNDRIKVLEYALHFKGVDDFSIERLMSRSKDAQGSKKWETKFENVLGHKRRGRVDDGTRLRRRDI